MEDYNYDMFDFEEDELMESGEEWETILFPEPEASCSFDKVPSSSYNSPLMLRHSFKTTAHQSRQSYTQLPEHIRPKEDIGIEDVIKEHALPFLPAKSLCRFRTVSKKWDQWIASPFLAHKQTTHFRDISGLLCQFPGEKPSFISFNRSAYGIPNPSLDFLPELVDVRTTSNGLVCCQGRVGDNAYYICNPVTRQWKQLPRPTLFHGVELPVVLVFEPSVLNFKESYQLVCPVKLGDNGFVYFEIYSSRTSSWRICDAICFELVSLQLIGDGFYMKGFVYWKTFSCVILVFDLKTEEYGILPMPPDHGPYGVLSEMEGEICYLVPHVKDGEKTVQIYGNVNMSLKHEISLDSEILNTCGVYFRVLNFLNDDTLIILTGSEVIAYNVRTLVVERLSVIEPIGYGRYLPYVNGLVSVGHPLLQRQADFGE